MMNIYGDEAGFTGGDLLEKVQPYFVYATVCMDDNELYEVKDFIYRSCQIQGEEIKGKNLVKSAEGQILIPELFKRYASKFRLVMHEKKYALACKIVDHAIEPFINNNEYFYKSKLNHFIATGLYLSFILKKDSAEGLFKEFLNILRGKKKFEAESLIPLESDNPLFSWFMDIVLKDPQKIIDDIEESNGKVSIDVLDLYTTSLLGLLSEWGKQDKTLQVYCDKSKVFDQSRAIKLIHEIGLQGKRHEVLDTTVGFKLTDQIKQLDSKKSFGIQLADVIASSVFYSLKNHKEEFSKDILAMVEQNCLCTPNSFCVVNRIQELEDHFNEKRSEYLKFMNLVYKSVMER